MHRRAMLTSRLWLAVALALALASRRRGSRRARGRDPLEPATVGPPAERRRARRRASRQRLVRPRLSRATLALWDFDSPEQRAAEDAAAREAFAADETQLTPAGPTALRARNEPDGHRRPGVHGDRAAGAGGVLEAARSSAGDDAGRSWTKEVGQMDGLVHLPLDPEAWRVRGVLLRLEDFELRMEDGTLFRSSEAVGPDGPRVRGARARALLAPARRRARAASAVRRRVAARAVGEVGLRAPPPRGLRAPARHHPPRARSRLPDGGERRPSSCGAQGRSAAS